MINVVILNGGRGAGTIIPKLLEHKYCNVISVVNAYDDGKSTGEIRKFFGMLGPSDIRKVQELMLPRENKDYDEHISLFQYRYPENIDYNDALNQINRFVTKENEVIAGTKISNLKVRSAIKLFLNEFLNGINLIGRHNQEKFNFNDCSIMNCIYAGAYLYFNRNLETATEQIEKIFKLRGKVLPTSVENKTLVGLRENGEILYCEADIVELRSNVKIERVFLLDKSPNNQIDSFSFEEKRGYLDLQNSYVEVSPQVKLALQQANIIIYSAGTQHSSLYPTYLARGLAEQIADNKNATKIFVTNIGADYETPTYDASDYIKGAFKYLNLSDNRNYSYEDLFDYNFVNNSNDNSKSNYVDYDPKGFNDISTELVLDKFESTNEKGKHDGDFLVNLAIKLYEEKI